MSPRIRRWSRTALVTGVYLLGLAGAVDLSNHAKDGWSRIDVSQLIVYLPWATVGAILALRRPANPIGVLLLAFAWMFQFSSDPPGTTPAELVAGSYSWLVGARLIVAMGAGFAALNTLFVVAVVFPDGVLPRGGPGRLVIGFALVGYVIALLTMLGPTVYYGPRPDGGVEIHSPLPAPAIGAPVVAFSEAGVSIVALAVGLSVAVGSLVICWRRAIGVRRQQFTWVVAAFVVLALGFTTVISTFFIGDLLGYAVPESTWFLVLFAFPLPAIAIGIAVLRYRLYDIDRIVSRTIGYGVATVGLVASFAALTLALQQVLTPLTEGRAVAVAASTLIVFALFQPIHRRIQRVVDRRFDRARYDADRAATAFARGVRDETDLARVEDALVRTVDGTLAPATRTVWVRERLQRATS